MGNLRTQSKVTCKVFAAALVVFAVFSAQNALAIAIAESYGYFDWGTFGITGPGSLTYTDQGSTYQAGYTTPNNANDTSPYFTPNNWNDNTGPGRRENPAGSVYAESISDTPIKDVVLHDVKQGGLTTINNGNTNQGLLGLVYAKADGVTHGDILLEQYSADTYTDRWGEFTVNTSGTYTFSVNYGLKQDILVQDIVDVATTTASFYFYAGTIAGGYPVDEIRSYSNNLRYDGPYEDYVQSFSTSGVLTYAMDLVAGTDYYFMTRFDNAARAGSFGTTRDQPGPVPEPATILLVGSGLVGAVVSRRRRAKTVA